MAELKDLQYGQYVEAKNPFNGILYIAQIQGFTDLGYVFLNTGSGFSIVRPEDVTVLVITKIPARIPDDTTPQA